MLASGDSRLCVVLPVCSFHSTSPFILPVKREPVTREEATTYPIYILVAS